MTESAPLLCCLLYQELEVCTTRFGYFLEQIIMISLADTFHVHMQVFALKLPPLMAKARECTALPSGAHLALHFKLLRSDLPPFCYELVRGLPVFFSSLLLQLLGNVLSSLPWPKDTLLFSTESSYRKRTGLVVPMDWSALTKNIQMKYLS